MKYGAWQPLFCEHNYDSIFSEVTGRKYTLEKSINPSSVVINGNKVSIPV